MEMNWGSTGDVHFLSFFFLMEIDDKMKDAASETDMRTGNGDRDEVVKW